MTTFVVAHGAWGGGWAWKKMRPRLDVGDDRLFVPTYTGLGERAHLASPSIDLDTHIQDVLGVLEYEDLSDIILIGHSYGGMVATGVADRAPDRIRRLVYLDAFVPDNGQSLSDMLPPERRTRMREDAQTYGEGWRVSPNPTPSDTPAEDEAWITARRQPQSLACFETPLRLQNGALRVPRTYIYCTRVAPDDVFRPFAARARREGWDYHEIDASHSPQVTAPEALARILREIAAGEAT